VNYADTIDMKKLLTSRFLNRNRNFRIMKLIIVIPLIHFSISLYSQSNDSLVIMANKAYSEGDYHVAISLYEDVINSGFESAELYYNLGNAYYKVNQIPGAIFNYEKEKKIKPNDERINFNLAIVNRKVIDKIEEVPQLFIWDWWRTFYNIFSERIWTIISIVSFSLVFILLTVFLLSKTIVLRKISFWTAVLMLLVTFISLSNAYILYRKTTTEMEAVIFTPTITVKSSPDKNSVDLFVLHEGTKVKILDDEISNWYEIEIADGSEGWLQEIHLRKI